MSNYKLPLEFGKFIKYTRESKNLSVDVIVGESNGEISKRWLTDLENNKVYDISISKLIKLSEILSVKLDKLVKLCANGDYLKYLKKHTVNEDFFTVWTEKMAYVLGFWYAEGSHSDKIALFKLSQQTDEDEILYKIADAMECSVPIRTQNFKGTSFYGSSLVITNKNLMVEFYKIVGDLPSNKSLYITIPDIPKEFIRHFLRGYFDGDGWVNSGSNIIGFGSISKEFIDGIEEILREFFPIIKMRRDELMPNKGTYISYRLYISTTHAVSFAKWLTEGATIYHDRKYKALLELVTRGYSNIPYRVLTSMRDNSILSIKELVIKSGISDNTVKKYLNLFLKNGYITNTNKKYQISQSGQELFTHPDIYLLPAELGEFTIEYFVFCKLVDELDLSRSTKQK